MHGSDGHRDHVPGGSQPHAGDQAHARGHAHAHAHAKGPGPNAERRILAVLALTAVFMVAEAVAGWLSGSLALIADATHMLSDTAALALAYAAFGIARRPSDHRRTYGYHRFEILAAFANGLALFAIAAWIFFEAVGRLRDPVPVLGGPMLVVALLGLLVNLASLYLLRSSSHGNLNVRAAFVHVLGDVFGSIGAILAAVVILATGWTPIDPILSVLVAVLVLRAAWDVTRRSAHVLMEGAPEGFHADEVRADLVANVPGVADVHHVHAWALTTERPLVTLHVRLDENAEHRAALRAIKSRLASRFGIDHSTVQVDYGDCPD
jgi:cobalt-zinc-cadmium efflux system protein